MKKRIALLLVALLCMSILTACGKPTCEHEWYVATCDTPKTCALCGKTNGEPTGHLWAAATCQQPKTCTLCGLTEGEALEHSWIEADCENPRMCSVCGEVEGEPLGHSWVDATTEAPKTCSVCGATEGEPLSDDFVNSTAYSALCTTINESMGTFNPKYEYDQEDQIFYISLTAPEGTAQALTLNPSSLAETWEGLADSLCTLSSSAKNLISVGGYPDVSCCIMLLNDANTDNVLMGILDGAVIYDVMDS